MNFIYNFYNNLERLKDLCLLEHVGDEDYIDGQRFCFDDGQIIQEVYYKEEKPVCKIEYSKKGIYFYENNQTKKPS